MPRLASAAVDSTARMRNKGSEQNFLTPQGRAEFRPTSLLDFFTVRLYGSKISLEFGSKFGRQSGKRALRRGGLGIIGAPIILIWYN